MFWYIDNVNSHCCVCILCNLTTIDLPIWRFCFPPLTRLDKPELAHTQRLLLVFVFIQTCRPASSVLPVGYLALSLSTLSLSSQDRTQQVTQRFRTFSIHDVSWNVWLWYYVWILRHMASFMVKRPFEMKVNHWYHFVRAAADVKFCVGILCI